MRALLRRAQDTASAFAFLMALDLHARVLSYVTTEGSGCITTVASLPRLVDLGVP